MSLTFADPPRLATWQIIDERMLVYFNDVLSVGMPPDLYNQVRLPSPAVLALL